MWWADFEGLEKRVLRVKERRDEFLQGLIDDERNSSRDEDHQGTDERKSLIRVLLSLLMEDLDY